MEIKNNIQKPKQTYSKKDMSKIVDKITFVSCIIGFIVEIFIPELAKTGEILLGIWGAIYCTYYTALCFCPIKRDCERKPMTPIKPIKSTADKLFLGKSNVFNKNSISLKANAQVHKQSLTPIIPL